MKAPLLPHNHATTIEEVSRRSLKAGKLSSDHYWGVHVLSTLEQVKAVRPIWEKLQTESLHEVGIEVDFERYLSVVQSTPRCEPYTLLVFRDGVPRAMLIGTRRPVTINCKLGYLKVVKPWLRCIAVTYGGYLGDFSKQTCRQMMSYLYKSVCDDQADAVMFKQLPLHSPLYSLAREGASTFCRSHFPKVDMHWRMNIPDKMESFYAQHSSKTRQTLKRYVRRLDKNFRVRLTECSNLDSLSGILSEAASVSLRTYQHALGWGLMDDAVTHQQLITAFRNGWLLLRVLYLDESPCAFQLGLRYRGTYFLQEMGFNPEMKKWHLGTVLFLKILDQLCKDPSVDRFDFGFGDAEYKRRFGTEHWDEATVYIFAPRVYPVMINSIHTIVGGVSEGMRLLVKKTGLEGKIKQKWRSLLQNTCHSNSN